MSHTKARQDHVWETELTDKPVWTLVNNTQAMDMMHFMPENKYGITESRSLRTD